MRNLVQKYRPRTLDQLCGQPRVVDVLRRHLRFESRQALLLVGPSGTGKTTAARVVGAGIACERTAPEPCGACPSCNEILGTATANFNWYEVDAARFSDKRYFEHATRLLGSGHPEPWTMFLDELHRLDDAAADSLLKSVEEPGRNSRFIGATTELSAVRPALRKRCIIVPFLPMSAASSFGLLKEVCEKEGLRFEPTALDMIASASEGSARQALIVLDLVASEGDVTCQQVADALAIGTTTHLLEYFDGVIAADADAQRLALYNWQAAPAEKAQLIRAYLLQVYTRHIAPTPSSTVMDPAFYQISDDLQRDLVIRMKPHAGKRPLPDFWLDLLDAWEFVPAALSDHPALLVKVHRFHRMVHGEGLSLVDVAAATPSNARAKLPYRSRSMKLRIARPSGIDAAEYLSFQQAETLYDAASMIGQEYGLLFNTAVRLRHAGLGGGEELNAGRLVSQLLHELRLRMRSWVPGERLHWIYVHERSDAGVITELVLHVPPMALLSFEDWLPRRIANMCRVGNVGDAISIDAPKLVSAAGNSRRRVQRHWSHSPAATARDRA